MNDRPNPRSRHGLVQPHHDYLAARFGQGITADKTLYKEICARGYRARSANESSAPKYPP